MCAPDDAVKFTVDFSPLQTIAAVALNRWAQRRHLSARMKIAEQRNVSPRTVDDWVQGRRPVPPTHLAQLVRDLDEGFALEMVRELARRGEFSMLARIFRQHINRILEESDAPADRNASGRTTHGAVSSDSDCGLGGLGRPVQS